LQAEVTYQKKLPTDFEISGKMVMMFVVLFLLASLNTTS